MVESMETLFNTIRSHPERASSRIVTARNLLLILILVTVTRQEKVLAHALRNVEQLTRQERVDGLEKLWREVKDNFAWFEQVPDLDWDKALQEYRPKAAAEQTNEEYYTLLQRFLALLHDGHTSIGHGRVWGMHVWEMLEGPRISIENIEGKAVIVGFAKTPETEQAKISVGMEITKVDGRPVDEILQQDIYPFVSASTTQARDETAYAQILKGTKGSQAAVEIRDLKGNVRTVTLTRKYRTPEPESFHWRRPPVELRRFPNGIVYVAINSFFSEKVVSEFDKIFDNLENVKGMIIDVRNNGGGNSSYGDSIIGRLTNKKLKRPISQPTQKKGRLRSRLIHGLGRMWRIRPRGKRRFLGPLVVLVGVSTGSAAENFVVVLHGNKRATVVGGKTSGSTGQPVFIDLPGGGSACICAKKSFYPDKRPFVGVGIIPDVEVYPTQRDVADGRDVVQERGLEVLRGKVKKVSHADIVFKTAYPAISEGDYYLRRGQLTDAIHSYKEALALESNAVTVHLKLADAYSRQGHEREALKHCDATGLLDDDAWMIIGPFSNAYDIDFDTEYPPEKEIDFTGQYTGTKGKIEWFKPERERVDGCGSCVASRTG